MKVFYGKQRLAVIQCVFHLLTAATNDLGAYVQPGAELQGWMEVLKQWVA